MIGKNLDELLVKLGFSKETTGEKAGRGTTTAYGAPAGQAASIYLGRHDESALVLDRVTRIELEAETVVVTTGRKERYGVELDQVRAVRVVPDSK
jgi:hypothetical protein